MKISKRLLSTILSLMIISSAVSAITPSASAVDNSSGSSESYASGTTEKYAKTDVDLSESEAPKGYALGSGDADEQINKIRIIASGEDASSDVIWSLADGCLTISGEGSMTELIKDKSYPWSERASEITSVVFESGITDTGYRAFVDCINLTQIEISDTVTEISSASFYSCYSLESVELPDSVKTISRGAFAECTKLKSIICNGVTNIEDYAFQSTALEDVTLGKNVSNLSGLAYFNCKIKSYSVDDGNESYAAIDGVLYSKDLKTIILYPQCKDEVSFAIPQSVTTVGYAAFIRNRNLEQITISESVTKLESSAFQQCYSLLSIAIPDSVTDIDYFTFYGCSSLKSVKFGSGLKRTSYQMFRECSALSEIDFGTSLEELDAHTFAYCYSLTAVKLPESIKTIGNGCFGCCYGLESFESANLSEIPFQAFLTCSSLKDVKLNSGVTKIFRAAFLHCNSLEEITLPESVVYVHPYAFPESTEITCENSEMRKFGINGYRYLQDISITGTNNYEYAFSVLELVNTEREAQGLSPLVMNQSLLNTAMQRAAEISACFSHTRPDSSLCFEANPLMIAENVAAGQFSPDQAMDSWMNSDGHRKNILSGNYSTIGIGCFEIGSTLYWTQCFGNGENTENCPMPANDEITQTISLATEEFGEAMTGTGISFSFGPEKTYSYSFYVELDDNYLDVSDMTNAKLYLKNAGSYNTIPVNNMGVSWNSSSYDVAAVDLSGKVAAISGGRAEIKATMKYFTSSAELTVFSDVLGDANDDGVVDAKDRMFLSRYLAKWKDYEAIDIKAADVNNDGEVNAKDRMILARHLAKWKGYETLPLDK